MIHVKESHLFCIEHGSGVLGDCEYDTHNPLLSCHLTYVDMACCPQGQTLNIPLEVRLYILVMISISGVLLHLDLIEIVIMITRTHVCVCLFIFYWQSVMII